MRAIWAALIAACMAGWCLPAGAETRVALVVGNSAYQHTTVLANPVNDARDMSAALRAAGFEIVEALDADKRKMDAALRSFADKLAKADVALLFYAGHGLQLGLQNYLVPVDAKLERERDLEFEAVKLEFMLRQMEIDREGKTTIVILDACRDNPLSRNLARTMGTRSAAIGSGLAAASTGLGTFIAYSTQPGNVALDGEGRNSPFTAALVRNMGVRGRNLPATMIEVRKDVVAATSGKQVPWDHSALTGDFYFMPGAAAPVVAPQAPSGAEIAALQERLKRLEAEAKSREAVGGQGNPQVAASVPPVLPKAGAPRAGVTYQTSDNVRIDGLKITEQRKANIAACQEMCDREAGCIAYQHGRKLPVMGQCELFSRIDARQEDAKWRSGVRTEASLPVEAAPASSGAGRLPAGLEALFTRTEKGFDIYEGVMAMGEQIKMSTADSPAGCQIVCTNTPGCIAATYDEFFRGKNVACQVYRAVRSTMKSPSATMMVRIKGAAN